MYASMHLSWSALEQLHSLVLWQVKLLTRIEGQRDQVAPYLSAPVGRNNTKRRLHDHRYTGRSSTSNVSRRSRSIAPCGLVLMLAVIGHQIKTLANFPPYTVVTNDSKTTSFSTEGIKPFLWKTSSQGRVLLITKSELYGYTVYTSNHSFTSSVPQRWTWSPPPSGPPSRCRGR